MADHSVFLSRQEMARIRELLLRHAGSDEEAKVWSLMGRLPPVTLTRDQARTLVALLRRCNSGSLWPVYLDPFT